MKPMKNLVIGALIITTSLSWANNEVFVRNILATAKVAGSCGILDSLIDFQKKTKMNGGDEFVSRFWAVEAARLGMTVQQLSDTCNEAVSAYGTYWSIADNPDE